jgi:cell division protein FtsQ
MTGVVKFFSLFLIFFLLSTYAPNKKKGTKSIIFPTQNLIIENHQIIDEKKLIRELQYLIGKSLFFINKEKIRDSINNYQFISSFRIKKIYPKSIKIIINEKKPVAIYMKGKDKYYISEKGNLVKFIYLKDYINLPTVFGKKKKFNSLYKTLKVINFPIKEIKSLYFFDINRWDILLKNQKTIKLSTNKPVENLKNFLQISNNQSFNKYKIFDYRINNQLILN